MNGQECKYERTFLGLNGDGNVWGCHRRLRRAGSGYEFACCELKRRAGAEVKENWVWVLNIVDPEYKIEYLLRENLVQVKNWRFG